ncbi:MAG: hypothetical protein PG978_000695 [Wolbachia endosymbiont of Ctenocephalides felis wCfeF]|nr:MAG: hypothetical protein PG978_000695 [Wolbachia endosymbiont of Ctenocephalides felis wCfeF]
MTDLINSFHVNNFFEEDANYTMCIDGNCINATGELYSGSHSEVPHPFISRSREYTFHDGGMKHQYVSFDLECLIVLLSEGGKDAEGRIGTYLMQYKVDESQGWLFNGDTITFKANCLDSPSKEAITVSIQKNKQ